MPAPAYLLDGPGYEIITASFGGKTFRASRRTFAHLWETQRRLSLVRPGAWLRIIQPSYNTGVDQSAGTHDWDAVLDVEVTGWDDWWAEQRFLRECGWAAWVRYPPTFGWHHHMVSLGYTTRVGEYVPGQVDDYYRHAMGLAGQHETGSDPSWHPADIDSTVFSFPRWRDNQEDDMPLNADDKEWIRRTVEEAHTVEGPRVREIVQQELDAQAAEAVTVRKPDGSTRVIARDQLLREVWQKLDKLT